MSALHASNSIFRPHAAAAPVQYEQQIYQRGLEYERPPFTFKPKDWEAQASSRMSAESEGYVVGNAGTGETARKNREAFARWSIIPQRLVRTAGLPDLSTQILGHHLQFPMALAPVGVQRIFNPDGEKATARAAAEQNVPYIMSTASSTSIEDVAEANGDGIRWFQLYWPQNDDNEITASLLRRAKRAGFTALVVTLDTYILGWRPSDMDNGYAVMKLRLRQLTLSGTIRSCVQTKSVWRLAFPILYSAPNLKLVMAKTLKMICTQRLPNGLVQFFLRYPTIGTTLRFCRKTGMVQSF